MTGSRTTAASLASLMIVATGLLQTSSTAAGGVPTCDGEPATIVGTTDDDVLVGTDGRDVVVARAGDDVVRGLSVKDVACGGPGADRLTQDPDDPDVRLRTVMLYGEDGDDRLFPSVGQAYGGDGHDVIVAGPGTRQGLDGGDGDDVIRGGEGRDFPSGGDGDDRLYGGPGRDYLRGEQGADLLVGGPRDDVADGGRDRPDTCRAESEYGCER